MSIIAKELEELEDSLKMLGEIARVLKKRHALDFLKLKYGLSKVSKRGGLKRKKLYAAIRAYSDF